MRQKSLPLSVRYGAPPARRNTLRPPRTPDGPRTARDWLLTLPIVLLLPALIVPLLLVAAGEPTLSVRGDVRPGALIEVVGTTSGSIQTIDFTWDGAAVSWLPATPTDDKGSFALTTTVAPSVAPGIHQLTAVQMHDAGGQLRERWSTSVAVEVRPRLQSWRLPPCPRSHRRLRPAGRSRRAPLRLRRPPRRRAAASRWREHRTRATNPAVDRSHHGSNRGARHRARPAWSAMVPAPPAAAAARCTRSRPGRSSRPRCRPPVRGSCA